MGCSKKTLKQALQLRDELVKRVDVSNKYMSRMPIREFMEMMNIKSYKEGVEKAKKLLDILEEIKYTNEREYGEDYHWTKIRIFGGAVGIIEDTILVTIAPNYLEIDNNKIKFLDKVLLEEA